MPFASLRSRLFLVVAAAITPFVLYAALTATRERTIADAVLRAQSLERARVTARRLDDRLQEIDRLLDTAMARVRRPNSGRSRLPQAIDTTPNPLAATVSIGVIDTSGRRSWLMMGPGTRIDAIPIQRRTLIVTMAIGSARQRRDTAASTFVDEGNSRSDTDSIAMIIVRALPRPSAPCRCLADAPGALVAVLSDRAVQELLSSDAMPTGAVSVLMGSAGLPLGRIATPERWLERGARDTSVLVTRVEREGMLNVRGVDGIRRAVGFAALSRLPWRVYVGVPRTALSLAPDQRLRDALMLTLLALAIAAAGVVLASRAVSAPLQTLVADARRLAAGALSHRTDVAERGGDVGAVGIAMNALAADLETKRRAMQDDLRRAQQIFDESPVPMWVTDASPDSASAGRIRQINPAAAQLFDVTPGALIGQRDVELLDAEASRLLAAPAEHDVGTVRHGRTSVRGNGAVGRDFDVTVTHPDTPRHPIRIVTLIESPLHFGEATSPSLATPDARVAFAARIADDYSELLHGIAGFSQLAADSADDPDMRAIAVERIRDLAHHGLAMAQQLRAYGQRDVLQLSAIDVNDTVTDVVQAMAGTLGQEVELDVRFSVAPATVLADQTLLHRVVAVLVANAREAMPAGGTLTLATTFVAVPTGENGLYAAPPGRYIVLTIADTGTGMGPDAQQRMFEPFYSTKREPRQGAGLGLASVDGIAHEHGWVIGVESEAEVGTAISIYMPLAPEPETAVPANDDQSSLDTVPARSA